MKVVGCDFHPSWQQVAVFDPETGEIAELKLVNGMVRRNSFIASWSRRRRDMHFLLVWSAAWTGRSALQPTTHPTDEDLSAGTPEWRPALPILAATGGLEQNKGSTLYQQAKCSGEMLTPPSFIPPTAGRPAPLRSPRLDTRSSPACRLDRRCTIACRSGHGR